MAVSEIHGLYAVRLFTGDLGAEVILDSVTDQNITVANTVQQEPTSGVVYPRFVPVTQQLFGCAVTTMRLEDWLDEVGLIGKQITTDTGKPGIQFYAQKWDETTSGRASGSNHRVYAVSAGVIVPRRLSCSQGGNATLSYDVFATYDGTNEPIVITDSQALPTLVGDDELFTIGGITLGSKTIDQVRQLDIDFGITVTPEAADGDVWATFAPIAAIQPTITLRGVDIKWWDDGTSGVDTQGLACTHANTTLYLRKRAEGGTHFVADGTAEHIKLTAAGIATIDDGQSGASNQPNETSITLTTKYDGTNVPIVITTASAIT